jgi:DNA polymerase I-like protein with 3'-5' exonuclease and polymerase domains
MEFPSLQGYDKIAFDTETTGLVYPIHKAFGFSISTPDKDYYYDIREIPKAVAWINYEFSRYTGIVVCHNASFDFRMGSAANIHLPIRQLDDTVMRACLINEYEKEYSLDHLCQKYIYAGKMESIYGELAGLFGGLATKNVQMPRISQAPSHIVAPYAMKDTNLTLKLHDYQDRQIVKEGIERIVEFELSLLPMFIETEMAGIRVDLDATERAVADMTPLITEAQFKLNKLAGWDFNVNSTPQVRKLFSPEQKDGVWFSVDGQKMEKTGKGQPSVNADFLRASSHPVAELVLGIRSMLKTRDTFLGKHILEHAVGDRVYPNINQNKGEDGGTGTGRLSYTNPAMQQIPSRNKKVAARVKPCFLPDEEQEWVDCDKASFEVRTFAHLIKNAEIIAAYKNDPELDFHQMVATMTGLPRNATFSGEANAKQLDLSMIFNSGNGAIAKKMGMPYTNESFIPRGKTEEDRIHYKKAGIKAMNIIERYHRRLPGIKELAERCTKQALSQGFVQTEYGRKLRFPRGFKAYKASGLLIQATAADWNKRNWQLIREELDGTEGRLILNTHDSYSLSLPKDNWRELYNNIKKRIEGEERSDVPLLLDLSGHGSNWQEALTSAHET